MKVAIILGLYAPVEKALRSAFPQELVSGTLLLLGQFSRNPGADMAVLKSRLCNLARDGAKDVLVVLAIFRGKEWVLETASSIAESVCSRYHETKINIVAEPNALAAQDTVELVRNFEPSRKIPPSLEPLRQKLTAGKALCVRSSSQTSFQRAFERAGYCVEHFDEFFEECEIDPGKNSNLAAFLKSKAMTYRILLYAWYGLRHAELEDHYEEVFKGPSTSDVVKSFSRWLREEGANQAQKSRKARPPT